MRAVVFAYQEIGYVSLEELLRRGVDVAALVTHSDDKNEQIWFRSCAELARANNIPVFETDSVADPEWPAKIAAFKPDAIFSFMFRKLIPEEILKLAPKGAFNLHPSLLPKYRGRCPANWALVNGETRSGLTLHEMVKRADAGAIVAQSAVEIGANDDIGALYAKLAAAAPALLGGALSGIERGGYLRIAQDEAQATKFGGRKPEDGEFSWHWPAERIHNLVRAVAHPYPGAFFKAGEKKIFVWKTKLASGGGTPGAVISAAPLVVAAGSGVVEVVSIQQEGGRETRGAQFAKAAGLKPGGILTEAK